MLKVPRPETRMAWAGALAILSILCLIAGTVPKFTPQHSVLSAGARLIDSLAPGWLVLAFLLALATFCLGVWRLGAILILSTALSGGHLIWQHRALSLPFASEKPTDLRVLFFNVLDSNNAQAEQIVAAALMQEPDLMIFTEAKAIKAALPFLGHHYTLLSDCMQDSCSLVVAARNAPKRYWALQLNAAWPDRYAVVELELERGRHVFVSAVHLLKPWLTGLAEVEHENLVAQYDWFDAPTVAVGDFNAAPWSGSMRDLLARTKFRTLREPFGSWPAGLGRFGVPIDHVLVHNGARVVALKAFGEGLGSNHRGFIADIAVP